MFCSEGDSSVGLELLEFIHVHKTAVLLQWLLFHSDGYSVIGSLWINLR